jgi:glutamate-1-semialdehyde 2,1-aminomutase
MSRGQGSRLWDEEGNEYLDFLMASGALILGHAHPEINEAVERQMRLGSTFYSLNRPALDLVERVIDCVPSAEKAQFCGSGSDATFYAMRLARAATGRRKILKFEGAFHGGNDYALHSWTPREEASYPMPEPDSAGIPSEVTSTVLVAPFNSPSKTAEIVERHSEDLAAVILEPLQRAIPPIPGFLETVRSLCDRYNIVLIYDEVVTGFRLGLGGAQEMYGVLPDLTCLGKALGGGYPMGMVTGPSGLMELLAHDKGATFMSGTLNGNPISASAGLATIEVLRRDDPYPHMFDMGLRAREGIAEALGASNLPIQVIGVGPMFQVFATTRSITSHRDTLHSDSDLIRELAKGVVQQGIFTTGHKNYISAVHTDEEITELIAAWARAAELQP